MKDLKYLAAFSIPVIAIASIYFRGPFAFLTPIYAFILIPIFELLLPHDPSNIEEDALDAKKNKPLFDLLLYVNLPVIYVILLFGLFQVSTKILDTYEIVGIVLSVGIVLGVNGINVAHELGHRQTTNERFIGKALLLPSFYMHFYIEHNFGHHLHAATKEDPATARYNQTVYSFWVTSVFRQYFSAWSIQKKLLKNNNQAFFSFKNDMFWFTIFKCSYISLGVIFLSQIGLVFIITSGIIGFLLLETVNYIEHYGLRRLKTKSGRYERVREIHSWNSNHVMGRIILYELTRHSDHHYKSSKKYQLLDYHDVSPQMPYGYPTSMVLSMVPPLWFSIMNKRIPEKMRV